MSLRIHSRRNTEWNWRQFSSITVRLDTKMKNFSFRLRYCIIELWILTKNTTPIKIGAFATISTFKVERFQFQHAFRAVYSFHLNKWRQCKVIALQNVIHLWSKLYVDRISANSPPISVRSLLRAAGRLRWLMVHWWWKCFMLYLTGTPSALHKSCDMNMIHSTNKFNYWEMVFWLILKWHKLIRLPSASWMIQTQTDFQRYLISSARHPHISPCKSALLIHFLNMQIHI